MDQEELSVGVCLKCQRDCDLI